MLRKNTVIKKMNVPPVSPASEPFLAHDSRLDLSLKKYPETTHMH